ncbi:hypothetical protein BpHYR1_031351 [Brachionus plicatilis]|uniref:Uncharacterized protein n=1 Tax=Brachionus plicatilis TaxID=10195 RepID=A0A3M7QZA1_BRAPC|nr:hypothetical protein BpHYR1_031351 [Brachionus plicatilis]
MDMMLLARFWMKATGSTMYDVWQIVWEMMSSVELWLKSSREVSSITIDLMLSRLNPMPLNEPGIWVRSNTYRWFKFKLFISLEYRYSNVLIPCFDLIPSSNRNAL